MTKITQFTGNYTCLCIGVFSILWVEGYLSFKTCALSLLMFRIKCFKFYTKTVYETKSLSHKNHRKENITGHLETYTIHILVVNMVSINKTHLIRLNDSPSEGT